MGDRVQHGRPEETEEKKKKKEAANKKREKQVCDMKQEGFHCMDNDACMHTT